MAFVHKNIKRFSINGEAAEVFLPRIKDHYTRIVQNQMESVGYTTRYDIDPDFTIEYNGSTFEFMLSLYGVYVGKRQAKCLAGIDKNREVLRVTQTIKSSASLSPAA